MHKKITLAHLATYAPSELIIHHINQRETGKIYLSYLVSLLLAVFIVASGCVLTYLSTTLKVDFKADLLHVTGSLLVILGILWVGEYKDKLESNIDL